MSTYTRASKIWGIILSASLAFSGIGTAFAVEGGTPESTPPSAPSAEGTGEPGDSSTPDQAPSGEGQGAAPSAGEADSGTATGAAGEGIDASTDPGVGLATAAGAATQASPKAGGFTITSESQLKGIFPDPTLRTIVFGAVKNGAKGAKGTDIWDALANFTGNIDAMGPYAGKPGHGMDLIEKAEGIQYLRNAGTVDIRFNDIEDLSFAAREQPGPNEDPAEGTKNKWYGGGSEEGPNPHNVTWHIAGNPLRTIPEYFGGRMVIEQPAAWFSHYANDNEIHSYVRGDGDDSFSGTLQIGRVKYSGPDKKDQFVEIDNIKDSAKSNPLRTSLDTDNDTMQFSGLVKSGKHTITVGTGTIFNYDTEAYNVIDDVWAITPGSQSFKYYTSPTFYVYDKVKLEQTTFQGSVELTKTDATGNTPLAGAEYSLYKEGSSASPQTGLKTGTDGKLTVDKLDGGRYYFVETKAPDGYLINTQPIPFTIDTPHTTLGGGKKTIDNLEGGASVTAGEGEVFIAGPEEGDYSPDIELTLDAGTADEVDSVEVTYSKLEQGNVASEVKRSFDTLQAAQNDINSEKKPNHIVGPVSIKVNYKQGGTAPDQATVSATNAKQERIEVSGTKTWVDNKGWTGERPAATIHLLRDGKDTGKKTTIPKSTSVQTSSTYKFTNLEKYDPTDGHEYQYTVKEDPVYITYKDPGTGFEDTQAYIPSYSGTNGTDITNTWPDGTRINIKGKKLWDDFNNADGKRPGSVTLELWQSEPGGTEVLYGTMTATAADNWEYHFELVPKFVKDADGKETDK